MHSETLPVDIDRLIQRLTSDKQCKDVKFSENDIKAVVNASRTVFMSQPMLL